MSPAQFKALVAAQRDTLTADLVPGLMTACARQFQLRELAMQRVGREIGQARQGAPSPPPLKKK